MLFIWLAVFFSSISWLYSLTIYTDPVPWVGWVYMAAAVVCAYLGSRRRNLPALSAKYAFLVLPLLFAGIVLPLPYGIAPAMLALAIPTVIWSRTRNTGFAVLFVAIVLMVQSLIPGAYGVVTAHSPTVNGLTPVVYWVLRFLNAPVSYSQDTLFFRTMRELYETQVTWAGLGLLPAMLFAAGGAVAMTLHFRKAWGRIARLVIAVGLYAILRQVLLLLVFLYLMYFTGYEEDASKVSIFWDPVSIALTFLPLALIAASISPCTGEASNVLAPADNRVRGRCWVSAVLLCAGGLLLTGAFGFYDPGSLKKGRVFIDEGHSEWTVTTKTYDTRWYGAESGYNYYCMAEYVGEHFRLTRNFNPISLELLDSCDVLVLKIPTRPYTEDEIEAVIHFVKEGGGLFLIGDHTNVFGSSTYLNPIARRFGFRFRYDCIFDIEDEFTQVYTRSRLLPHPIVQRMPPFLFAVSCSIEPESYFPGRVILAGGLKKLDVDYSVSNFYPRVRDRLGMWFGSFHQAVAVPYGRGRVVGFTDSTVYSNFSAFYPGKPEFLLGALGWLNRANRFSWANRLFVVLAACCFLGSACSFPRKVWCGIGSAVLIAACAVSSVSLGVLVLGPMTEKLYQAPQPLSDFTSVVFEQDHCDYDLPLTGFVDEMTNAYEIFYQWVLRLGYYPFVVDGIEESVQRADVLVLINPVHDFSSRELDHLEGFVRNGGRVLVAESSRAASNSADSLLARFGIRPDRAKVADDASAYEPTSQVSWTLGKVFHLEGGDPLLYTEEAYSVATLVERGHGLFLAISFSDAFADANMGFTEGVIPDAKLLHHYQLQFALLKGLVEGTLREALREADKL